MSEPFRVGSHHLITGVVKDNGVPLALTGATLSLKLRIDAIAGIPGIVKSLSAAQDPDQITNPGKFTYQCVGTDFDIAGTGYLQMFVTTGGVLHKSLIVDREVHQSLA
jgi:hypothetical protein